MIFAFVNQIQEIKENVGFVSIISWVFTKFQAFSSHDFWMELLSSNESGNVILPYEKYTNG